MHTKVFDSVNTLHYMITNVNTDYYIVRHTTKTIVELLPVVGLATGTTLGAADVCSAGPHSTLRSTNIFVETLSGGVLTGPDGYELFR